MSKSLAQTAVTNSDAITRWDLPSVSGKPVQGRRPGPTVSQLEQVEKKAYDEAFAAGREAGLAAARAEMKPVQERLNAQVAAIAAVFDKLSKPLEDMDAEVGDQLARLAVSVAKQVIRRELRMDPAQVIAIMRETVALLPASARQVRIHVHPEDAAVIRERLAAPGGDRAWSLIEDPVLSRGAGAPASAACQAPSPPGRTRQATSRRSLLKIRTCSRTKAPSARP
jgi:flagellar assembly protein FliH